MSRFRVFAGPNGSGKSTIIRSAKATVIDGKPVDFGTYVNADDIAVALAQDSFSFTAYNLENVTNDLFVSSVIESGLLKGGLTEQLFRGSYTLNNGNLLIEAPENNEKIAQIVANFLVRQLIAEGKKCSLETVFSHRSKIEMMRTAAAAGYKVYLYFVATEDPEINVARVRSRVELGGHNVPEDKIRDRYYRSLGQLYEAAQVAYQCYFFDNSDSAYRLAAHFKIENDVKKWDDIVAEELPDWFIEYYYNKQ